MREKGRESLYQDYLEIIDLFRLYVKRKIKTEKNRGYEKQGSNRGEENSQVLLGNLYHSIQNCKKCSLYKLRNNLVFGAGNPDAELMLIGEAPGREEDLQGKPFVGAAGRLLTEALGRVGLSRADVYIANILKCRPPGNRNPQPEEIEICFPYLERQIEIIKPKLICTMGNFASQLLLKTSQGITHIRGKIQSYKESTSVIPIFHPAACIYKPGWERDFLEDLRMVRDELKKRNNSKNDLVV
ncbi:MAG: uracil-DNA glycosylase [Clostridia bacterium]|nr:uracil-DNA glycosylase [Clostridia bacterium]